MREKRQEISSHPCFPLDADATLEAAMYPELEQAARLLLKIAGPAQYYMVPRPIMLDDCLKHLRGVKTRGAQLRHPQGMARALAFDAQRAQALVELLTTGTIAQHFNQVVLISHSHAFDREVFHYHIHIENGQVIESDLPGSEAIDPQL
jgi:hypothetical protein